MKNLNYLLAVLFAVALLTTSCEKEEILPDETPTGITTNQLTGNWVFYSVTIDNIPYDVSDSTILRTYGWSWISIVNVNSTTLGILDMGNLSAGASPRDYNLEDGNKINIQNGDYVFEIDNVETFDVDDVLVLKLLPSTMVDNRFERIYTLTR